MGPTSEEPKVETAKRAARKVLTQAGAFSFFVNILMLTGPLYMLQIYDRVLASGSHETLFVITVLTLGLFASMAALDFVRSALLARAGETFERTVKGLAFDMVMDAGRRGVQAAEQPLKDLRQLRQFVGGPALTAVFDAPWTPFFLLIIFLMHWLLGVVAVIGLIVLLTLAYVNEKASRQANATAQGMAASAERHAGAVLRNIAAADAMGMRAALKRRWMEMTALADGESLRATDRIGGLTATSKATRLFLQSAILGVGAFLAISGAVTPGVMIAASIITGRALAPIEIVTGQWKSFANAATAYRRFISFMGDAKDPPLRTPLPAPKGALAAEKAFCRPGGAKTPIIKGVSFEIAAGEALGIVGPSAAGKSTLARALVGVEPLIAGEIRIDGANIEHWDKTALGAHVGYLPQEVELFAGTAAQNIARLAEDASPEAIINAARIAGAHDMILGFPDGYDTEIGERGRHLSAGQRQRLGLARALYGDPALIVLDEPNANLDADGDAALARAVLASKERGATVVMIAHRPSAITFVDKILLLTDGEARAFGPRDEVLRQISPRQVTSIAGGARNKPAASGPGRQSPGAPTRSKG